MIQAMAAADKAPDRVQCAIKLKAMKRELRECVIDIGECRRSRTELRNWLDNELLTELIKSSPALWRAKPAWHKALGDIITIRSFLPLV